MQCVLTGLPIPSLKPDKKGGSQKVVWVKEQDVLGEKERVMVELHKEMDGRLHELARSQYSEILEACRG